jgi:quercetin dioxygenase-like cupin family protein
MKHSYLMFGFVLAAGIALGVVGGSISNAQEPLKSGTILDRTELVGAEGLEAILVLRELPPAGESGKHTQGGNEIVYVLEGSIMLEVQGKAPVTLKTGETFHTVAGEVHNVKNANAGAPGKALAFYIARKGASLEDISVPAK